MVSEMREEMVCAQIKAFEAVDVVWSELIFIHQSLEQSEGEILTNMVAKSPNDEIHALNVSAFGVWTIKGFEHV